MSNSRISQWDVIWNDKWLLSSLTWMPVILVVSVWWLLSQGIARSLPIGVVDLQQSSLSRQLVREFDATPTLKVDHTLADISAAKELLVGNKIYAYLVIPKNFDRDIYIGKAPEVTVFYNNQFVLIGKLVNRAAMQAHGNFNAQLGVFKRLAKGNNTVLNAAAKTVPIRAQITPLFNKNSNYAQFLISAIVPALWQTTIVVSTILFLAANLRMFGLEKMVGEKPIRNLLLMAAFYLPIFLLLGGAFLTWFYIGFNWPMEGRIFPLLFAQFVTAITCMIMGGFFFFLALRPSSAMSFAAVFTAPSFAFMGITFPVSNMGVLAQSWRNLMPISHYIEAQVSQVSYGSAPWKTINSFAFPMLGYLVPFILMLLLVQMHLRKQRAENDNI